MKPIISYINKLLSIKVFIIFNVLILILKIIYSCYTGFKVETFEDWSIARNIAEHGVYSEFMALGSTAYKLPVYPFFLSFFIKFFPSFPKEAVVISQHLLFFFVPLIIIKILQIFDQLKVGILSAFFFILSPAYFYYSNVLEATNVFIPIFLVWMYVFLRIFTRQVFTTSYFILFGFCTALLFLTQVVVVPVALIFITGLILFRKVKFTHFILILSAAMLFYSPWIIRNQIVFDKTVLTKTPVWQNIYYSFTSQANVLDEVKLINDNDYSTVSRSRMYFDEFRMEEIYKKEAQKVMESNADKVIVKSVQNAVLLWYVPSRYFYDSSVSILIGRKIFVIIVNFLSLFALIFLYHRKEKLLFFSFLLLFAGFTFPYMIGHAANIRFKLDFEYFQYILIAYFLTALYSESKYYIKKGSTM
ncbi:MAG: glycosyltransferase family 39 protein [Kaistella sp.]|nr:glycosyltransferase family 39 protein [Kaistella sp.]